MQRASAASVRISSSIFIVDRHLAIIQRSGMEKPSKIAPAKGKLGVLLPGMGAVSTTFMAGVELVRKGKSLPVGSLTQMGTIRLGKRTDGRSPLIHKFVPLAELKDLAFGG
jgi:myo-inositol-1-phosphate synthase